MMHCCKFETRLISILELDQVLCKINIISQSLLEYFFHPKTWKYSKTTSIVMTWDPLFDLQKNSFIPSLKKYEQQELQKLVHDSKSNWKLLMSFLIQKLTNHLIYVCNEKILSYLLSLMTFNLISICFKI